MWSWRVGNQTCQVYHMKLEFGKAAHREVNVLPNPPLGNLGLSSAWSIEYSNGLTL